MDYKNLVYFDIETTSKYKTLNDFRHDDKRGYDLFMKKIDRKSVRFEEWKEDPGKVYKDKTPLMPEFGKILCVTIAYFKGDDLKLKSVFGHDEFILIKETHKIFNNISKTTKGLCGYYIKGFDIPWLNKKFMRYGLRIPNVLRTFNVKPWDMNVYDLAEIWRGNGTLENSSFDEMLYDMQVESPKDDISGEDVYKTYWIHEDLDSVVKYCEKDVIASVDVTKKLSSLIF